MTRFEIRPATRADVPVMAETVRQGFEGYRAFLPPGWEPPASEFEAARISERLALEDTWCRVAVDAGPAGHVAFLAAREQTGERAVIPGLAHLWMLFVREPWWGSGLAPHLLDLAVTAAAHQGYAAMRLFTPAGQARARAFYEREGFVLDGAPRWEPMLAFDLVEYRRDLPASIRGRAAPA
ncbi:MAG TPA: GNAT family N-acetyltransferase [Solirubrobacteraceae bacterium]|nr:GNAT family N-acetyltransferase [Solirubrobacteraceae bacterium]